MRGISARDAREELARRKCRGTFRSFVRFMWPVLNPGQDITWNWHMNIMCDELEAITRVTIFGDDAPDEWSGRLAFNVPPGSTKSTIVSIFWPCWEWLHAPHLRYICASFEEGLSTKLNVKRRAVIASELYQWLRPPFGLQVGQREKRLFANDQWGSMRAVSTRGGVTGDHSDRLIIDDPLDPDAAFGPEVDLSNQWHDETASTRFTDPSRAVEILVQQRICGGDMTDHVMDQGGWRLVVFQAEFDPNFEANHPDDPRSEPGDLFFPRRFPADLIERQKRVLGSMAYAAQYQQTPVSGEGNIFDRTWWGAWTELPEVTREAKWVGVWDTAYEAGEQHDYTVCQVWVAIAGRAYLVDQQHKKMDFVEMERVGLLMARRWPQVNAWIVEQRALGQALIDRLRLAGLRVFASKSQSTKAQRAQSVAPLIEEGRAYLPSAEALPPECMIETATPWTAHRQGAGIIQECSEFPRGKHDDRVDALAMALGRLSSVLRDAPLKRSAPRTVPTRGGGSPRRRTSRA